MPVERGVGIRDDRTRVRVCGAFAGEVTGVEFLEGGVEVVEVERDCRCDPLVGVDLDDVQDIEAELLGLPTAARESSTSEDDVIPTGRYGIRRLCSAEISCYPEVLDEGVPPGLQVGVYHPTAVVESDVVNHHLRHGVPVAGGESLQKAIGHLACRVFEPPRRLPEFVEPHERGVEVRLVEELAAIDPVTFDRRE